MTAEQLYYDDLDIGDEIDTVERSVSRDQVVAFLDIYGLGSRPSRFTDDEHACCDGLPGAIVPGGMTIAMVAQLLTGWSPTVRLRKLDVVFRQVVPHNRPLELKGVITDKNVVDDEPQIECDVFLESEDGVVHVLGHASVTLPMRPA